MKKLLLFVALCVVGTTFAQVDKSENTKPMKAPAFIDHAEKSFGETGNNNNLEIVTPPAADRGVNFVNPIQIGSSANAYGFFLHRWTFLWADNDIKSVSFVHRMTDPPGSGYLGYDLSTDAGQTWTTNIQAYDPAVGSNARYPQGAIYNPEGNTDPNNAYFHYFAPTLDGSNDAWGGYVWGVDQLAAGSTPTANYQTSDQFVQYIPSGFTMAQDGTPWVVDQQFDIPGEEYQGKLSIGKGTWTGEDFDYIFEELDFEIDPDGGINDVKIAFAPDGQTGWICAMTELEEPLEGTTYHPVLFKTEDGGQTWDGPIEVQLGGPGGLDAVKEFITDDILEWYFDPEPVPARDEIDYFMGFYVDLAVDAWGNPHIAGMISIADAEAGTFNHSEGVIAMFHIYSRDQGLTFEAHNLDHLRRFDAEIGDISMYNRPQVATTQDGAIVFFSWLDTSDPDVEDNSLPDIYFSDYQPMLDMHIDSAENVTAFSNAMWKAYWGAMSHYVFHEVDGNTYNCTIPFVYEELTDMDPLAPVDFWYIPDYTRSYVVTDVPEFEAKAVASISNVYPNPAFDQATIRLNLLQAANVSLEVFSLTGQKVKEANYGKVDRGINDITVDVNDMTSGIYFYTITAGNQSVTKKLIVE